MNVDDIENSLGDYRLVDFGAGRKLEQFGPYLLDRPAPAAVGAERAGDEALWRQADARFERHDAAGGRWASPAALPASWTIACRGLRLEIKPTPFGHVGFFPEQVENWRWLADEVNGRRQTVKVLNLFAHTGGATLAAAAAGAEMVHVDSARNTVAWARRNAELSQLAAAPIRWIVEDAATFVGRECKRGNRYQGVILDPPSFGHGAKRATWKLERDLPELLRSCADLTAGCAPFVALTCHTPGFETSRLRALLAESFAVAGERDIAAGQLVVVDAAGRKLPSGYFARWSALGK